MTVIETKTEKCWEVADKNIERFKRSLDAALAGRSKANPDICRQKIDQWLEYRFDHGPEDVVKL